MTATRRRMNLARAILILSLGAFSSVSCTSVESTAPNPPSTEVSDERSEWVFKCLEDMNSLKAGCTRAEVLEKFAPCGGIATRTSQQFYYGACRYFVIDVTFKAVQNPDDRTTEDPSDIVVEVSKPRVEIPPMD
jgi:hypothetical protein